MSRLSLSYLLSLISSSPLPPFCWSLRQRPPLSPAPKLPAAPNSAIPNPSLTAAGKNMIKCPFDTALVFCEDGPSCDSLGFTDTISECSGSYVSGFTFFRLNFQNRRTGRAAKYYRKIPSRYKKRYANFLRCFL